MWTVYSMLKPESCFLQCGVKLLVLKLLGELLVQQWFSWSAEVGKGRGRASAVESVWDLLV